MLIVCIILIITSVLALGYVVFLKKKLYRYTEILERLFEEKLNQMKEDYENNNEL